MKFSIRSIQQKIALWTGLCLVITAVILVVYAVVSLRSVTIQAAKDQVAAQASSQAGAIDSEIEVALDTARAVAQAFTAIKTEGMALSREQANAMLKQVMVDNPQFLGISTAWEPDAFDGKDAEYVDAEGHDQTGRFIPYWVRSGDTLLLTPLVDYEVEGIGDWYLIPKRTQREAIIDPYLYPIDGKDVLLTSLMVPIVVDGQFYGTVGVDFRLDFLQELADAANIFDGAGKLALITYNGLLAGVTGSPELVGKPLAELHEDLVDDLGTVQNGEAVVEETGGNIADFQPIRFGKTTTPWSVNIMLPMGVITAQATRMMWQMIGIGALLVALALAVIWLAAAQIARPIKKITAAAQELARGSLAQQLAFHSQDEVGQLSAAFGELIRSLTMKTGIAERIARGDLTAEVALASDEDRLGQALAQMIANLRRQVGHVAESTVRLNRTSGHLAAASKQAGLASSQIAATLQQIAKGAGQQAESVSHTAASAEQMSRAIDGVARGAQEQATAVAEVSQITTQINAAIEHITSNAHASARESAGAVQSAQQGQHMVQETMDCMGTIKLKVDQSAQKVQAMGARSDQIGAIVEVIEDISSQTNLLALNAAIEAARAGEHGKGFAVVADEVRKLAERAETSTKEISSLVQDIQQTVTQAVSAMGDSAKEVERGVEKAVASGQALSEILIAAESVVRQAQESLAATEQMQKLSNLLVTASDSVSAVVEENSAAAEEMAASSTEVTQAIENIASVSEENSAAIEEVSASTEEMSAQVEEVSAAAQSLAEMAQVLQQVVAQFKLDQGDRQEPTPVEPPAPEASKPADPRPEKSFALSAAY